MTEQQHLLPLEGTPQPTDPAPPLSADQRRTARQAGDITLGRHPLHGGPLHPQAPLELDKTRRTVPFTCGACALLQPSQHHDRTYLKCRLNPATVTRGAGTDARAWWPACTSYQGLGGNPDETPGSI